MKLGRELDTLVAEHVIGYKCVCDEVPVDCPIHAHDDRDTLRPYSTDIAAAWAIAEMFKHGSFGVGWSREWGVPYAMIGENVYVYAETVPLAICLAALEAVGVEVEDETR